MKHIVLGAMIACSSFALGDGAEYVNPFVGGADNGHTFPGACVPFGLIQASPDTGNCTWQYCSGYMFLDEKIWGFSQTHLNGTGCPDLGDVLLMPFTGAIERENYHSAYSKATQKAEPGFYAVTLDDHKVDVQITAAPHVAFHRYTYKGGPARLLVDLQYGIVSGKKALSHHVLENTTTLVDKQTLTGHTKTHVWTRRDYFYVVTFDKPYAAVKQLPAAEGEKAPRYVFDFDLKPGDVLQVKVALSSTSVEGAQKNLAAEVPNWDFKQVRKAAAKAWGELFDRVDIDGTDEQKANFYTSLYHLFIQPNNIADVDGRYRGADDQIHEARGGMHYSTLSLWDTFRAAHPLYTILAPERVDGFVNTMIAQQRQQGFLPIWALWGQETYCMIGNHAVPVIVDAYLKGYRGFDVEAAFDAIEKSLTGTFPKQRKNDWAVYNKYGYLPLDIVKGESVSRVLEYAMDDDCAARMAKALGKKEAEAFFAKRAQNYRNVFDPETKFMRGKDSKGNWRTPFDPFMLGHGAGTPNDFTEGNSWQYTWHVQQAPDALIALMGGKKAFADKLDSLFTAPSTVAGQGFVLDVSGLVGQYAHGNEPSHHVAYLFQFADRGWRTQELIREICDRFYVNRPDGLCGNDDCGQMSAWYVFACMGFYPVNPCNDGYVLGAPQVEKITLKLPNGKKLVIRAKNLSKKNKYVEKVELNGTPVAGFKISHGDIMNGGTLTFTMTDRAQK